MFGKSGSSSSGVQKLWNFLRRFLPNSRIKLTKASGEYVVLLFLLIAATTTYLYGSFKVVPEVLASYPVITILFVQVATTWVLFGVFSNLYLIRKRNSSIRNRMLLQPVIKKISSNLSTIDPDSELRETTKHLGEHFKAVPFGDKQNWHICAVCEVFVPPRTWHCHQCNTCVLRRDHHCIFTGCCIGEENQSNFLGLLLYLGLGASTSAVFSFIYYVYFEELSFWWYLVKVVLMVYTIFIDYSLLGLLACISTMGQIAAWGTFGYYVVCALKAQTSADAHRKIIRIAPGTKSYSLKNMTDFLGSNPIQRILWPFHTPFKANYGDVQVSQEEYDRKGL